MDIEKWITVVGGIFGIVATFFTIVKSVADFRERQSRKKMLSLIMQKGSQPNLVNSASQSKSTSNKKLPSITPVGAIVILTALWHLTLWFLNIPINYIISIEILVIDMIFVYYLLDRLVYFFAQFVLPIQNPKDRLKIYGHLKSMLDNRGPVFLVKNGRILMREDEYKKRGPGIILLDTASAVVLRTDTAITDIVGAGIKFTSGNEYIAESVDLRSHWQYIDPRVDKQQQTNGLTRDGFDVSPIISIKFRIKRRVKQTTKSGVISQYDYDAISIRKAIQFSASGNHLSRWNELPAQLVVNIWREYVHKFKLGDLITSSGISSLKIIEEMINKRVKHENIEVLDDTGNQTGEWLKSHEFEQLQSRGLEIMDVHLHHVIFDDDTEKQIIDQWNTTWLNSSQKEKGFLKARESLMGIASRDEVFKKFAKIASSQFGDKSTLLQVDPLKTLQLLIQPLMEFASIHNSMDAELRKLDEIWGWLQDNNPDRAPRNTQSGGKP